MGNMEVVIDGRIYVLNVDLTSSLKLRTRKLNVSCSSEALNRKVLDSNLYGAIGYTDPFF
jgi:hypothetical protein